MQGESPFIFSPSGCEGESVLDTALRTVVTTILFTIGSGALFAIAWTMNGADSSMWFRGWIVGVGFMCLILPLGTSRIFQKNYIPTIFCGSAVGPLLVLLVSLVNWYA